MMSGSAEATIAIAYEDVFGNSAQIELLLERGSICLNALTLPAMSAEAGAVKGQSWRRFGQTRWDMPLIWLCRFNPAQQLVDSLIDEAMQSGS